jgi:hypothetical protein
MRVKFRIDEKKYKPTRQSGKEFFPSLRLYFLASCFLTWRVKILNYLPVLRLSWKTYPRPWIQQRKIKTNRKKDVRFCQLYILLYCCLYNATPEKWRHKTHHSLDLSISTRFIPTHPGLALPHLFQVHIELGWNRTTAVSEGTFSDLILC